MANRFETRARYFDRIFFLVPGCGSKNLSFRLWAVFERLNDALIGFSFALILRMCALVRRSYTAAASAVRHGTGTREMLPSWDRLEYRHVASELFYAI